MNALVSLDSILEPAAALTPASLFGTGQVETILAAIEKDVRAEAYDITTPEGRDRIKSVAYKIARSKTTLDEIGKEHVAEIKAQSAKIDKERKTLRDRLDALKDEVRGPLTAWETAEANRINGHEYALVFILHAPTNAAGLSSAQINELKAHLEMQAGRDWQEFDERALEAFRDVMPKIVAMRDAAEQRERDAAELEALRKEKAEREERDRKAEAERLEQIRKVEQAARQAKLEQERAEEAARWKAEAEERATRQAEEAAARAVEAERVRVAREKAEQEIAERKRQEDEAHRAHAQGTAVESLKAHLGISDKLARRIVDAIAADAILFLSIEY